MRNDYTIPLDGEWYQIERRAVVSGLRKASVRVERRLDGSIAVRFGERYLPVSRCAAAAKTKAPTAKSAAPRHPAARQRGSGVKQSTQEVRLGQRNTARRLASAATANGAVGVVAGVVVGHHGVGVVVAAVKKYADQRLVVSGVKGGGFAHGGQVECKRQRGASQRELTRAAQKSPAAVQVGLEQVHGGLARSLFMFIYVYF